jgi:hypothetical protein
MGILTARDTWRRNLAAICRKGGDKPGEIWNRQHWRLFSVHTQDVANVSFPLNMGQLDSQAVVVRGSVERPAPFGLHQPSLAHVDGYAGRPILRGARCR